MKKIISTIIVIATLNSCGQTTKNKEKMITKEQYNSISKEVKKYDYNPTYQLRIEKYNCPMELYINDVFVVYLGGSGKTAGEQRIEIPQYILKSGKQHIRIKILPLMDKDNTFVSKDAMLRFRVVYGDYEKENPSKFKEVFKMQLPVIEKDLPIVTLQGEFEATVPYVLEGWSNGVDLSDEDPKKLAEEVLEKYHRYRTAFENKDVATIATMIYRREKEIAQAFYFDTENSNNYNKGWEELEVKCNDLKTLKPIEDFDMKIFGNGKIVALLKKSAKYRNYPVVYGSTGEKLRFYGLFFFRPKAGAPLEVIR